ncbi:MAG: hypothetical protein HN368_00445, partial [Spirochaetales bacterium]|nr:hypothetical protein [Spirochaetales bacterium]
MNKKAHLGSMYTGMKLLRFALLVAVALSFVSLYGCEGLFGGGGAPDYEIATVTFPASGTVGEAITGSFTITNAGDGEGGYVITWTVYLSTDETLDSADTTVESSALSAISVGQLSDALQFTGTWPDSPGSYYLIISLTATDDTLVENNATVSNAITIDPIPAIDYTATDVVFPGNGYVGDEFAGSLYVSNVGSLDGAQSITWTAYLSSDQNWGLDDTVVGTAIVSALAGGGSSARQNFLGTWPATPGTYYLIAVVDATDDANSANDEVVSPALQATEVDYQVNSPTFPASATVGDAIAGDFTVTNIGGGDGFSSINWSLHISADTV